MPAPKKIRDLVARFREQLEDYKQGRYNETQVRKDFIDPFFEALGWDMDNKGGYATNYRDVIYEDNVKVDDKAKKPDYAFCIGGQRKFFVEAKKPSINIKIDESPALQVRRYGWSAKLPLSIVTDFEEFAVYDTKIKPSADDRVSTARMRYYTFEDYIEKWDEIADIFSKEAILKGKFDSFVSKKKGKGTVEVDEVFLKDIEKWRAELAKNIVLRNDNITSRNLNYVVQITIDRILFLRICEDRNIEEYGRLKNITNLKNIYKSLLEYFYQADDKYNSGLFHFKNEKNQITPADTLTPNIVIDDNILKAIIKGLYYPKSQYEFSVMPADILGNVYEQFLGKNISLTESGKRVRIEEKPEVRKAGGVYYTPKYIVDYIVENTVGALVKNKTPDKIKNLTVLDPACGSGSFLIVAYQYLLDYYLAYYLKTPSKYTKQKRLRKMPGDIPQRDTYRLTIYERKRILLAHIYGVDIDAQAVEVTKLSLLLKVLEGENKASIKQNFLLHERALPNLADNIKCGNSLIASDFYRQGNLALDDDEQYRINVFDWNDEQHGFGKIIKQGGFDAVIGNPPWVFTKYVEWGHNIKDYLAKHYTSSSESISGGKAKQSNKINLFAMFLVKGIELINKDGLSSFIIPNTILRTTVYDVIRKYILDNVNIDCIVDLKSKVFYGVTAATNIMILSKNKNKKSLIKVIDNLEGVHSISKDYKSIAQESFLDNTSYVFNIFVTEKELHVLNKISLGKDLLGLHCKDIIEGIVAHKNLITSNYEVNAEPLIEGKTIERYHIRDYKKYIIWKPKEIHRTRPEYLWNAKKKIIIRRISGGLSPLFAALDTNKCKAFASTNSLLLHENSIFDYNFILGLLNSKTLNFYYSYNFSNKSNLTVNISKTYLEALPIPKLNFENKLDKANHNKMVALVEKMLNLQQQKHSMTNTSPHETEMLERAINASDKAINNLTYKLYGLTAEEITTIEAQ